MSTRLGIPKAMYLSVASGNASIPRQAALNKVAACDDVKDRFLKQFLENLHGLIGPAPDAPQDPKSKTLNPDAPNLKPNPAGHHVE